MATEDEDEDGTVTDGRAARQLRRTRNGKQGPPRGGPGASRELLGSGSAALRASRARRKGSADRGGRENQSFSESGCRPHGSSDFEAREGAEMEAKRR